MPSLSPPSDAQTAVLRLLAASGIGSLIGLNRWLKHKPAGLRTHALVSLGAALLTLVGVGIAPPDPNAGSANLSRVIQGIITGIGFLGAGVILRPHTSERVHGLTTAASLWLAAALGVGCAVGEWTLTLAAAALTMLVLLLGGPLERLTQRALGARGGKPAGEAPSGSGERAGAAHN